MCEHARPPMTTPWPTLHPAATSRYHTQSALLTTVIAVSYPATVVHTRKLMILPVYCARAVDCDTLVIIHTLLVLLSCGNRMPPHTLCLSIIAGCVYHVADLHHSTVV